MLRATALIITPLLAACGSPGARDSGAQQALLAANQELDKALLESDAAALDRLYTDDYRVIDDDGGIHAKADQVRFMTTEVDVLEAHNDDVRVSVMGDAALVTGRLTGRYRLAGKEAKFVERYTSVWVRDGARWRVKHEHTSSIPQTR